MAQERKVKKATQKKDPKKVRTIIDVDRQEWAFVKSEATLKGEKTSDVVERIIKQRRIEKEKEFRKD